MLGCVGAASAVLDWVEEEEEGDPYEIDDGDVSCGGYLGRSVQGLDNADRERPHSCWRRILFLIGRQLASQAKVELPHWVLSGVVGPHGCKYLTNQVEVLLNRSLPLCRQKSSTDALRENMEEGNGFFNVFEIWGYLQPAAEAPPLAPGSSVFLEDCG